MIKIGITYDLKDEYIAKGYSNEETAEFEHPDTVNAIEAALRTLGYKVERIGNAKELTKKLAEGKRWDMVFNICEGLHGFSREAQVPNILDLYNIPYTFSDPLTMSLALHKGHSKTLVRSFGVATPKFKVVTSIEDLEKLDLSYPLFAKPIAEGTSKGINDSRIESFKKLKSVCLELLEKFKQPVLVEEYLPGREFTVGLVGTGKDARVLGVLEILITNKGTNNYYSFDLKTAPDADKYFDCALVSEDVALHCEELALKVWKEMNCRDAGRIDIRLDINNIPNFIEVNPLAGLKPDFSDLVVMAHKKDISYIELIKTIVDSAFKRVNSTENIYIFDDKNGYNRMSTQVS